MDQMTTVTISNPNTSFCHGTVQRRVWIADENEQFRRLLARLLGRADGLECPRAFATPELLLVALRREAVPDTILLDLNLCERGGIDFVRPIRNLAPDTRILVLTSSCDSEPVFRALQAGASGTLLKGVGLDEVLARIRETPAQPLATWRADVRWRSTCRL